MIDLDVQDTLSFIEPNLSGRKHLLEVGCGKGKLARELMNSGYNLKAIDSSDEAVVAAKTLGVDAQKIDFLEFKQAKFDAICFTRSLHHIDPLAAAVAKIDELLEIDGVVIIEDFAAELLDENGALWRYAIEDLLVACAKLPSRDTKTALQAPLRFWQEHHFGKHKISDSKSMIEALSARFHITKLEYTPYLYRYFVDGKYGLAPSLVLALKNWETKMIDLGSMKAIGIRLIATRR
ncbi:MAG: class I SAM-dependent methyltransferase [Candidatus Obscuribacterales bacterium]|nr:class I SAM-dependent methyltransferase [Candidatus Obscuribacterales bacterium]